MSRKTKKLKHELHTKHNAIVDEENEVNNEEEIHKFDNFHRHEIPNSTIN